MLARVTSHPPLGHETVVPHGKRGVAFNVLIETQSVEDDWEVQLWHNLQAPSSWEALPLQQSKKPKLEICQTEQNLRRLWFSGALPSKPHSLRPVSFTVKFRVKAEGEWKWVRDHSGAGDGQLLYQPPLSIIDEKPDLSYYLDGLSPEIRVEKVSKSDTPQTSLWSLTAKAEPAHNDTSGYSTIKLGLPRDYTRWFALVRLWSPWLAPRQGKGVPFADKDAVLYSFLRKDGLHVVMLAISGIDDVLTVLRHEHDSLTISARNDRAEESVARVVVAVGASFEEANAAVMYHARGIISRYTTLTSEEKQLLDRLAKTEEAATKKKEQGVEANWVQDWYDGFTYCTWNGLGQNLTEEKISGALESLEKNGIRITNLIIDDNWQSLDNEGENQMVRGWKEFEANPKGFPQGFKQAIGSIRQKYPDIKHIAVWHALLGYWGGISPSGKIAQNYKTLRTTKTRHGVAGGEFTVVDAPDVARLYNDFYSFLSSCGIDSVKTDAQFFLDELDKAPARRSLTNTYLHAWTTAQLRHFSGRAISCMSQTPPIIFRCQLPRSLPALPVRLSDDFFPDIKESHPWHIFCNAHNALMASMLNVLPDWDMFQTGHEWAGFHAAARCISGGPVYVTDEPGRHDVGLIEQMTARTIRGQTVVLRCGVVGRSIQAYLGFEEERLCLVGAYHGAKGTGAGVLAAFNCREGSVTEVVSVASFMGTEEEKSYIIRSHRTGDVSAVLKRSDDDAVVALQVAGYGWEILTAFPVSELVLPAQGDEAHDAEEKVQVATLGLVGKMTGYAAVLSTAVTLEQAGKRVRVEVRVKALGTLGVWSSTLEGEGGDESWKRGLMVLVEGRAVPVGCVGVRGVGGGVGGGKGVGGVLEVDLERAWREMGLQAGWSNEVGVCVFLGVG